LKLHTGFIARTLALGLFAALLGFCYSITTQADCAAPRAAAAPRLVGSNNLRFLLPASTAFPGDMDIGDAVYGSNVIRYITATGGIRVYAFASPNLSTTVDATSTITVLAGGLLRGLVQPPPLNTFTDLAFNITVQDSTNPTANVLTRQAHLTLYPGGANLFRFAQDKLNDGVLGQAYICKLETISAKGTTFTGVVPGTLTVNGTPIGTGAQLEAIGLSMAADGTVYGRPLVTGLISFQAFAVDALNRIAKDRTNSVPGQVVTFNISDGKITTTDATILGLTINGDTSQFNTDILKLTAFMNLSGANVAGLLLKRISVLVGGASYEGFMDQNGKIVTQLRGPLVFPDGTKMGGTVDSVNGTINIVITRGNLTTAVDGTNLVNRSTKRLAVAIVLGDFVIASDTIEFQVKHIGNKFGLQYAIGRIGRPLGGGFQIYDAAGKDGRDIAGNPGDSWTTKFLIYPRFGIDDQNGGSAAFTDLTSIGVRVGTNFSQTIPVSALKITNNGSIKLAQKGLGASVQSLTINPAAFSGSFTTNQLSVNTVGLPQGGDTVTAPNAAPFDVALDINRAAPNASFSGEDSKHVLKVPLRNKWVDRNTKTTLH